MALNIFEPTQEEITIREESALCLYTVNGDLS